MERKIIELFLGSAETEICPEKHLHTNKPIAISAGQWDSLGLQTPCTLVISTPHEEAVSFTLYGHLEFPLLFMRKNLCLLLSRYFPQVLLSLMAILPYYVYFPGSQGMLMSVKPTFLSVAGFRVMVRAVDCKHANQTPSAQEAACRNRQLFCSMQCCLGRGSSCRSKFPGLMMIRGPPKYT